MSKSLRNLTVRFILPLSFFFLAIPVYADYSSLQNNDCTLLQESDSNFKVINSTSTCSSYTPIATTSPINIQVFGKCTNGDIKWPRFDVFTYSGIRGSEVGGSKLYQAGSNYPLFSCDNANRNVNGTIKMPAGTNQSFFVAVSNASSSAPVVDLFEKGIGSFLNALIHFDIKSAFQEPPKPDPVIIIPGILGSSDKNGVWVIDPIFHTYDDLIDTLKANGYVGGKDLFTMPYDWRESNVLTALELRNKINEVQDVCQCDKVDLVAHSMGGLVARQYIQSDKYENDVDQLIFLGTPHLGAPKSYLMWEGGENNIGFTDRFMKLLLNKEAKKAGFSSLFDYIRNRPIPSVQELLPTYDYLRDKSTGNLRVYSNNYPQNTFLENLKGGVPNLLDKVKVTNIVGELGATSTINTIRIVPSTNLPLWEHGYPDGFYEKIGDMGLEKGSGDGTVSNLSSGFINNDLIKISAEHIELPSEAEGIIFKKLTSKDATTIIHTWSIPDMKLLIIKILSPVDVVITAPDSKRIGKDFATNQEVNEIAGAFYSGFLTDNEYLTIPNPLDGEYKIQTQGTDSGPYTIATGYVSDNVSVDKDFTAQTKPGLVAELNLSVNNTNPTALEIKPTDITPPVITAISPESKDYARSELLSITVDIQDSESGVFSSEIKFDDRIVNNGEIVDLFFEKLGNHALRVNAADFVDNAASTTINFRIIATPESTIADIERAYSLNWINKESVKNTLIKKLENIINHNRDITQKTLKTFLSELEREHPKHINDQAYELLKENINWLLNN